jgi:hypothetical protein
MSEATPQNAQEHEAQIEALRQLRNYIPGRRKQ